MRIEHEIRSVTYMKRRAAELLRSLGESRRPVVITQSGEPKGATLLLRLLAEGEADVRAGRTVAQARVFSELRARLTHK